MKWTLILLACLLAAVINISYAEEEKDDVKELAELENAIINSEEEKDMVPVTEEDEEKVAKMLNNKAVRKRFCVILYRDILHYLQQSIT